ncbi:MAG TPA: ABC transporter ATP-binding protein [Solirubrobacteraceae bacterium]|nr:ABC transporter ATP-binding protein [Solirubrobacteraceae bacterium]
MKRYDGVAAVDGVDLEVRAGDIYGFLGPNGAGKTTTMRMLLGLVRPDSGSIRVFGRDPTEEPLGALEGVAGIIEEPRQYLFMSGRRNLELLAAFDRQAAGRKEIDEVLDLVELRDRADDVVSKYSQGMRQRLGIASCLLRRPRLLMLDEPANGVDPAGLRFLRDLLRQLAERGVTIFLSSHLLAEVQEVCSRVAVISAGRIVYEGSLAQLRASAGPMYRLRTTDLRRARDVCDQLDGINRLTVEHDELVFSLATEDGTVALTQALADANLGITSLAHEQATLEGLFFSLTEQTPDHSPVIPAR